MPAVSLSGVYNFQGFTDAGALAASFRLYTYAPATTTKKTAYTEPTGSTAHTYVSDGSGGEYIAVNARGELAAPLFLASGGYDLCLKTAAGVTIWTRRAYGSGDGASDALASLAASGGSALVGYTLGASDAVATTVQQKLRERVSIHDFMTAAQIADANAGTMLVDVTTAWEKALLHVLDAFGDVDAASIYFPVGRYLITKNNWLGDWTAATLTGGPSFKLGLTLHGDGWGSQIVWRPTSTSDVWIYDNGSVSASDNSIVSLLFSKLMIRCEITNLSGAATMNGFRVFADASGPTQNFAFDHCRFLCVDRYKADGSGASTDNDLARAGTFLKLLGTINASENKWIGCKLVGWGTVLDIGTNDNALNHIFLGTDCDLIYGDVFKVAGGANIVVYGGSFVMLSEAESYLVAMRPTTSQIIGTFSFHGGRTELNKRLNHQSDTALAGLLLTDASGQSTAWSSSFPVVRFDSWNAHPIQASARVTIKVDAAMPAKVSFDACSIGDVGATQLHQLEVNTSKADLWDDSDGPFLEVTFSDGNAVPWENVSFDDANSHALISARNCSNTLDYELTKGGVGQYVVGGSNRPLKTVFLRGRQWPDAGDNGVTNKFEVTLPTGALLKKCAFRKAANAGTATAGYQLAMADGAAHTYCTSVEAAQNVEHKGLGDNLMILMDDAIGYASGISAAQSIYMIAVSGHTGSAQAVAMGPTDYALVEYW